MANIHINRSGTALGVFAEDEVKEGLKTGRFIGTDLGWREGMANWQPLAQFSEFADLSASAAAPAPSATPLGALVTTAVAQSGLPWDRRQELGFFPAFFETLKLVLLNPAVAFTNMKPEGGLGEPLIYGMVGGSCGFLFYFLFSIFMSSFGIMSDRNALAGLMGLGIGTVFILLFIPVFLAAGLFIGSGILHLCLMLVGGAKRTFETTFRVVCFCAGSAYPLMIVPVCGGFISGIWHIVIECIGLSRAHETTTGKAVLAVFLPIIVCCAGGLILGVMFGTLGALLGHHH